MAIDLFRENIFSTSPIADSLMEVLTEGDTIVPDSKPDILHILQVDGRAVIAKQDVQENRVVFTGSVDFTILYHPDSQTEVKSINTSLAFNHIEDITGLKPDMSFRSDCDVTHIEFDVLNSRKISIKAIVSIGFKAYATRALPLVTDYEGDELEVLRTEARTCCLSASDNTSFCVADRLEAPMGKPPIFELLKTDARITDKDIRVISNKIVVKGSARLCALYTAEDETLQFMEYEIPFTEVLDIAGVREDMLCDMRLNITSIRAEIVEDQDGENRALAVWIDISAGTIAFEEVSYEVISDCYKPGNDVKITKKPCPITEIVDKRTSQLTLRDNARVAEGNPSISQIYSVMAKPYVDEIVVNAGKVTVNGTVDVYILYFTENENSRIFSFKHEIAFNQSLDCPTGDIDCDFTVDVQHCDYNFINSDELDIRCLISTIAIVFKNSNIELIDSVEVTPAADKNHPSIVIYFVQNGDTLWDVAKRYKTTINNILYANALDDFTDLRPGMQLIIPKSA